MTESRDRFDRQIRFAPLGVQGQARLRSRRVLLVGCGGLGGVLAQTLVRCGVGELVLVDRDVVDVTNLARQVLFEARHAAEGVPKVAAALETLARMESPTRCSGHALHLDQSNLAGLARECDLILDGTDNLSTRYLLNDFCVAEGLPWIYAGVVGAHGLVLPVLPERGPCLRCLFPDPPPPGSLESCDADGVLLPAVGTVASFQAGLALRLLVGRDELSPRLYRFEVWSGELQQLEVPRQEDCPCCARRDFAFLREDPSRSATVLCGRNAVQVRGSGGQPDLAALERSLSGTTDSVRRAGGILRFAVEEVCVTLFQDGRALVQGTSDADRARSLYDRFVGS